MSDVRMSNVFTVLLEVDHLQKHRDIKIDLDLSTTQQFFFCRMLVVLHLNSYVYKKYFIYRCSFRKLINVYLKAVTILYNTFYTKQ